jgi:hypothetical protein
MAMDAPGEHCSRADSGGHRDAKIDTEIVRHSLLRRMRQRRYPALSLYGYCFD